MVVSVIELADAREKAAGGKKKAIRIARRTGVRRSLPFPLLQKASEFLDTGGREDREDCRVMIVDFGFLIAGLVVREGGGREVLLL